MKSLVWAALALIPITSARAQTNASDAGCFLVANAMVAQGKDEPSRTFAKTTAAFFLGRLSALSDKALLNALRAGNKKMSGPEAIATLTRCGEQAKAGDARVIGTARLIK